MLKLITLTLNMKKLFNGLKLIQNHFEVICDTNLFLLKKSIKDIQYKWRFLYGY